MKRNGPMVTLLAGIGVAMVFFLLSMRATQDGRVAAPAADPVSVAPAPSAEIVVPPGTPAAVPSASRVPLAAPVRITATWAGYLKIGTLALSAKNGAVIAYVCDGRRVEAWLKGTAENGRLKLTGKKGASLTGSYGKDKASGKVKLGNGTIAFSIKAVAKPSGLYRAAADVRGAKLVGGWIVLPDGSQVGLGNVDGTVRETSALDLATGSATIGGIRVTAARTEGTA